MKSYRFGFFLLATAALAGSSSAQRTFVLPHILERDGGIAAFIYDVSGGKPTFEVTTDATGRTYQPGRPTYGNITFEMEIAGSKPVWDAIGDLEKSSFSPFDGALYSTRANGDGDHRKVEWHECFLTGITMPSGGTHNAKNGRGVSPIQMTLSSREGGRTVGAGQVTEILSRTASPVVQDVKPPLPWNPEDFDVSVEGFELSVLGFTPEEVRAPANARVAGEPLLPRLRISCTPFAVRQGLGRWYDNYIGKGDYSDVRDVTCTYTDRQGRPLLTLTFEDCGIYGLAPDWSMPGTVSAELIAKKVRVRGWDPEKKEG